jgi:hypothetical protein
MSIAMSATFAKLRCQTTTGLNRVYYADMMENDSYEQFCTHFAPGREAK